MKDIHLRVDPQERQTPSFAPPFPKTNGLDGDRCPHFGGAERLNVVVFLFFFFNEKKSYASSRSVLGMPTLVGQFSEHRIERNICTDKPHERLDVVKFPETLAFRM